MLLPSARLKREYASVTAAYRRIDVAMEIAGFVWGAMPQAGCCSENNKFRYIRSRHLEGD